MSSYTAIIVVVLLCFVSYGSCANPQLAPNGTTIIWNDNFTEGSEGTDLETEYDAKGLQPLYNFVNSFIGTVLSKDPYDLLMKVKKGELTSDYIKDEVVLGYALGMTIVVGIGILFCLIMPIVGLCFCCCRCCGKCGGEMSQKDSPNNNCKRAVFGVILLIITLFMFTGVLLTFVCNDKMTDQTDTLKEKTTNIINEAINFADRTVQEAENLLTVDFPFVKDQIQKDISDSGVRTLIADPVLVALEPVVGDPINNVRNLSRETTRMRDQLEKITNNSRDLNDSSIDLQNGLNATRQNLTEIQDNCTTAFQGQSFCTSVDSSVLQQEADFSNLPDVSDQLTKVKKIVNLDFEASAEEGLQQVRDIPETILNKTKDVRKDINIMLADARETVEKNRKDLRKTSDDVISKLEKAKTEYISDNEDDLKRYDNYRWMAGVGLTCILLLIVVLMALGLMCGICGHDKESTPTTRGTVSNMGGISLMAATGFCFIFASFLMLLTTICFIAGAPVQTVCKSIQSGDFIKEVVDNPDFWDGEYILSKTLYDGKNVKVTVGGFIQDCRENKPIYEALKVNEAFNVSDKFDIKKLLGNDTDEQFDKLNVDLSDKTVLNDDTRKRLNDLMDSGVDNISFSSFLNETRKGITAVNLLAFADNITKLANKFQEIGDNTSLPQPDRDEAYRLANRTNATAQSLRDLDTNVVKAMENNSQDLETNVEGLQQIGGNLKVLANTTLEQAKEAERFLHNEASDKIKDIATNYTDRTLGWGFQFSDHILDLLENKLAKCKPISNIYDASIVLICNDWLYPFNGFWFSLGWCLFFFIPAIIFNVKLAKHYRRMDYESDFDQQLDAEHFEMTSAPPPYSNGDKKWANPNGYNQYPSGPNHY